MDSGVLVIGYREAAIFFNRLSFYVPLSAVWSTICDVIAYILFLNINSSISKVFLIFANFSLHFRYFYLDGVAKKKGVDRHGYGRSAKHLFYRHFIVRKLRSMGPC